ncbi:SpaH/EbpB family LPXTG-anchored major pilin [Varibaculum vaginae]|uniref:SpaH/EbpB family LPXTG-anchored major pilin n=1 Tax=Varibaculum vaginae TaxID=2364797 RepID=UPI000F089261|nr:SpaH/EbpB family LPXTG-anchored major pilin [Varibaculum vaginae]
MFSNTKKFARRGMALAAALGMAALGLVSVGAPSANAEPTTGFDMTKDYTINVWPQTNDDGKGDKSKTDGKDTHWDDASKLPSGKFKLEKGNYAVNTTAGYNAATKATVDTFKADPNFTALEQELTEGKTSFTVKPGLYKLTQTVSPDGYQSALPALILVPMTDKDKGTWMDTVTVYPKNGKAGVIKKKDITPDTQAIIPGSEMTFQIDSPIPTMQKEGNKFNLYQITDTPSKALKVDKTNSKIQKVEIVDGQNLTPLKEADYELLDGDTYGIKFTTAGLGKLQNNQGKVVRVTLTGKVAPANDTVWNGPAADWVIENKASYKWDSEKGENGGNTTGGGDHPTTKMANVKIMNKDNDKDINDKNAEFSIYSCAANSTKEAPVTMGEPLYTGVKAGKIAGKVAAGKDLCIEQTKAPDGYEKGAIQQVQFTAEMVKTAIDTDANSPVVEVEYQNNLSTDSLLSKLPLTGGAGIALFLIVAAGLLGGAYYYARRNRVNA